MDFHVLKRICEEADLRIRSYSGRAMYGDRCVGIDGDNPLEILSAFYAGAFYLTPSDIEIDWDELTRLVREGRMDSMGKGVILYFPSVSWPEGEVDSDEMTEEESY